MLSIHLNSPELERFVQNEFKGDEATLTNQFLEFLRFQKLKNEVQSSIDELDRDEYVEFDEAFNVATAKYEHH